MEATREINARGLLKILLAYSPDDKLIGKVIELHTAVFRLKNAHQEIDILFDTNGHFPYAEDLDIALQSLAISGIIWAVSPTSTDYKLQVSQEGLREGLRGEYGSDSERLFRTLAEEFYEKME